jgi:hypothetical protein
MFPVVLAIVTALRLAGPLSPRTTSYDMTAELDDDAGVVRGSEHVRWRNSSAGTVRELAFHLYMNAFRDDDSVYWREAGERGQRSPSAPEARGGIEVTSVRMGGVDRTGAFVVEDSVGRLPLETPVPPGGTVELDLEWRTRLPRIIARAGRAGDFFAVAQWFPKLGVLTCPGPDGPAPRPCGFRAEPYHHLGEFFADFGTYDVRFTVPARFRVGATGVLVDEQAAGGRKTLHFRAEDVHDFVLAACPRFESVRAVYPDAWGEIELELLVMPEHAAFASRHLRAAAAALGELEQLGPYPYRRLTIVDVPDGARRAGSQEYPTLVFTQSHDAPEGMHAPEATTAHETAHQFFYGLLASDEIATPWLDEGLAESFTDRVLARLFGRAQTAYEVAGHRLTMLDIDRLGYRHDGAVDSPETRAFAFLHQDSYHASAYAKIALAVRTLEDDVLDPQRVVAGLRRYVERWRFAHPDAEDFVRAFDEGAGEDLHWFWNPVLFDAEPLDYLVLDVAAQPLGPAGFRSEVVLARRGGPPVPVEVDVRFADGRTVREKWTPQGSDPSRWRRFVYEGAAPVDEAVLAPAGAIALDTTRWNDGLRRLPDPQPRRRFIASLGVALLGLLGAWGR